MTVSDKSAALRLLLRRGITAADIGGRDKEILSRIARRFARGNISIQHGSVLTAEQLDEARERLRQKFVRK